MTDVVRVGRGDRRGPVTLVPIAALDDERLDASAIMVLLAVRYLVGAGRWGSPRQVEIAKIARKSRGIVNERLALLARCGYVERRPQAPGRPCMYRIPAGGVL